MKSKIQELYKIQIKYFITPRNIILALLFTFFSYSNFFIRHQFFSGNSASLGLLFSAIPYISIIIIPALSAKSSFNNFDDFLPFSSRQKLICRFLSLLTVYTAFLLLLLPAVIFISFFFTFDFSALVTGFCFLILFLVY